VDTWNFNSAFLDNRNEIIGNILEKLQSFRKSSKLCCNFLFSKLNSTPTKQHLRWKRDLNISQQLRWNRDLNISQQLRWNRDLNISPNTEDWLDIYKICKYQATHETKLRSFQIKLNLLAIMINIALHGFKLIDTNTRAQPRGAEASPSLSQVKVEKKDKKL